MSEYPETKTAETECADLLQAVLALRFGGTETPLLDEYDEDMTLAGWIPPGLADRCKEAIARSRGDLK